MRGEAVVVGDPARELAKNGLAAGEIGSSHVVAFDRVHECFSHAVGFGAVGRGGDGSETEGFGLEDSVRRGVGTAVVRQPTDLDGCREDPFPEAGPERNVQQ